MKTTFCLLSSIVERRQYNMIKRALVLAKINYRYIHKPFQIKNYRGNNHLFFNFSELPKGSQFSNFMGLSQDLQKYRKEEQKKEISDVRSHSLVILVAIVIIGTGLSFLVYDQNARFYTSIYSQQLKLNIFKSKNRKAAIVKQTLLEIFTYLNKRPYQFQSTLQMLLLIITQLRSIQESSLLSLIAQIYLFILNKNFKAAESPNFIKGLFQLTQFGILSQTKIEAQLINMLLIHGSIKEIYLGLMYFQRSGENIQNLRKNLQLMDCINKNLKQKIVKSNQYQNQISEQRLREEYPQIQFRLEQEHKWIEHIQQALHINCSSQAFRDKK